MSRDGGGEGRGELEGPAPEARDEVAPILAPPPLIYGLGLTVGLLLDWLAPRGFLSPGALAPGRALGGVLIGGALVWMIAAERALASADTPPQPWKPTRVLVTSGPYGWSRNPLYLGMHVAWVGVALALDNAWLLAAWAPILALVRWGVVGREERYLESRFGRRYRRYRAAVRRWLGRRRRGAA